MHRVVPWEISWSSSSNRNASEIPSERPRWISWPEPVTTAPGLGSTGRRNDIESSAVVIPCPGPTSECTTDPRAASPITASIPAEISPEELANQGDAGIEKLE